MVIKRSKIFYFGFPLFLLILIILSQNIFALESFPMIEEGEASSYQNISFFDSGREILLCGFSSGFEIDKDIISIKIKPGEIKRETLELNNPTNESINLVINPNLEEIVAISERIFVLNPGEKKTINLDFFATEKHSSKNYIGSLRISSGSFYKMINIIVEVQERKPLFDVLVDVVEYEYLPGEIVKADIEIINMGDLKNIDILLHYSVKDFEKGALLVLKEESLAINDSLNLQREVKLPSSLNSGTYVFDVMSSYENIFASGKETFEVINDNIFSSSYFIIILTALITSAILLLLFNILLKKLIPFRNSFRKRNKIKTKKSNLRKKKNLQKILDREIGKV